MSISVLPLSVGMHMEPVNVSDSYGWVFENGDCVDNDWTITQHTRLDKFGNPFIGVAERVVYV